MNLKSVFYSLVSIFIGSNVFANTTRTTYKYELLVNETIALKFNGELHGVTLIPVDQQEISKSYSCELEIIVETSNQPLKGRVGSTNWVFNPKLGIYSFIRCPGASDSRVSSRLATDSYFFGDYKETNFRSPSPPRGLCTRNERLKVFTGNYGDQRLLFDVCDEFDPNGSHLILSTHGATFVMPTKEIKGDPFFTGGRTQSSLKLENGKISGASDEVLFTGTYKRLP